jgi:predicted ATP-grasp superfamily ATP-dependent carboligase
LSICKDVLDKLNWEGFADFDVLETKTGDYKVIEINPRIPASVRASAISGVNFGEIIVCDLMCNSRPKYMYQTGKSLRYIGLDIAWFLASSNRFSSQPSWFRFFDKNVYCQEGGFSDFIAMMYSFFSGVKKMLSPSFMRAKKKMN